MIIILTFAAYLTAFTIYGDQLEDLLNSYKEFKYIMICLAETFVTMIWFWFRESWSIWAVLISVIIFSCVNFSLDIKYKAKY